jgi:hypothetical protein
MEKILKSLRKFFSKATEDDIKSAKASIKDIKQMTALLQQSNLRNPSLNDFGNACAYNFFLKELYSNRAYLDGIVEYTELNNMQYVIQVIDSFFPNNVMVVKPAAY